jgi:hypothetical protein
MSYIRIIYQVKQKYLHIIEATIIPHCRRVKIENITVLLKQFWKLNFRWVHGPTFFVYTSPTDYYPRFTTIM